MSRREIHFYFQLSHLYESGLVQDVNGRFPRSQHPTCMSVIQKTLMIRFAIHESAEQMVRKAIK